MNVLTGSLRVRRLAAITAGLLAVSCSLGRSQDLDRRNGRLAARPRAVMAAPTPGQTVLAIGRGPRGGFYYVPSGLPPGPAPLVVLLHGAGGAAQNIMSRMANIADSVGFVVLVPDSRGPTWDAIRGVYGPDITYIDSALKVVFSRVSIDPARIIASGFSDGASYALALARINGDLFTRVVAFSPGFIPPGAPTGRPEVYITHGSADPILPFEATSMRLVPAMQRAGYTVTLKQFVGGHTVPADLAREAFRWAISTPKASP